MTDIQELEKRIVPPPLSDEQMAMIRKALEELDEPGDLDAIIAYVEAKYAHKVVMMTREGHDVKEAIIRVTNDLCVCFRIRGLDVKCRIWQCTDEFDLVP